MNAAQNTGVECFLANFRALEDELGAGPDWLTSRRREALDRFAKLGIPTTKHEDYRFTNLRGLVGTEFEGAPRPSLEAARKAIDGAPFADLGCPRAVIVDGYFVSELSTIPAEIDGARIMSFARALEEMPEVVEAHFAKRASIDSNAFNALNTAFARDGLVVHVPTRAVVEQPIHILSVTTDGASPVAAHGRYLIVAETSSQVTVVETHVSTADRAYLTNPVTEIVAGANANVDHYRIQAEAADGFHVGSVHTWQDRDSVTSTHTISVGGRLARNDAVATLGGMAAEANLNGLYLVGDEEHVDNHTTLVHAAEGCSSREVYKGVLDGSGRAVFHGRILVEKDAQETDSYQTNNNLLLSRESRVNTKPQLEIYADQVKCSHGATIGQMDAESVFYLRSRGIDRQAAEGMLIFAFASEVLDTVRVEALREQITDRLFDWLPQGDVVREALR
ncbi:MAG: Fe-S cluster assembly protein SufD [Candidatus Poribacteria bacterium]